MKISSVLFMAMVSVVLMSECASADNLWFYGSVGGGAVAYSSGPGYVYPVVAPVVMVPVWIPVMQPVAVVVPRYGGCNNIYSSPVFWGLGGGNYRGHGHGGDRDHNHGRHH